MPKPIEVLATPWWPERDDLIIFLRRVIDRSKHEFIRDRAGTRGVTEDYILTSPLTAKLRHFLTGRNNLTVSVFNAILERVSLSDWSTRSSDIAHLSSLFDFYNTSKPSNRTQSSNRSTIFISRTDEFKRFYTMLDDSLLSITNLTEISNIICLTEQWVILERRKAHNGKSSSNSLIIFDSIFYLLTGSSLPSYALAGCLSFIAYQGAYAAHQANDIFGLNQCIIRLKKAVILDKNKYTLISYNLGMNLLWLHNMRMCAKRGNELGYSDQIFARTAYDVFSSSISAGILDKLPYEPGILGNAALEYEIGGAPMSLKPDRFGNRSLADILKDDISKSEMAGRFEGAARLAFGLGRGFLRSNLDEAEQALERGFTSLSLLSHHPTARAKGLLLEGQLIGAQRGRQAAARVIDRLLEARSIYVLHGVGDRISHVDDLLKLWN